MVPIHQLRDSAFYQLALNEGREEGREEMMRELLLEAIAQRFPGLNVQDELVLITDLAALKQLLFDLDQLADAAALQAWLSALTRKH